MTRERLYVVAYFAVMVLLACVLGVLVYGRGKPHRLGWDAPLQAYTHALTAQPGPVEQRSQRTTVEGPRSVQGN